MNVYISIREKYVKVGDGCFLRYLAIDTSMYLDRLTSALWADARTHTNVCINVAYNVHVRINSVDIRNSLMCFCAARSNFCSCVLIAIAVYLRRGSHEKKSVKHHNPYITLLLSQLSLISSYRHAVLIKYPSFRHDSSDLAVKCRSWSSLFTSWNIFFPKSTTFGSIVRPAR